MTNAEMFERIFGFALNENSCYTPSYITCPIDGDCKDCPYDKWLDEEYTGEFKKHTSGANMENK